MKNLICHGYYRRILSVMALVMSLTAMLILESCSHRQGYNPDLGRQRALRLQRLRNLSPGADVLPEMQLTVDSMRRDSKDVFYFASMNVLIDQLFSLYRIAEADSMASIMLKDAAATGNEMAVASAHRVKGQIYYKLGQPGAALTEFEKGRKLLKQNPDSIDEFTTAATIDEWIWITSRTLGDIPKMNIAGLRYAAEVEKQKQSGWSDPTRHFEVTALAFRAADRLSDSDINQAKELIDSAGAMRLKTLTIRAYEHFYSVRSQLSAVSGRYEDAVADIDSLIAVSDCFPWFKAEELRQRAQLIAEFDTPRYVADAFTEYMAYNDSIYIGNSEARLRDLTILYRTEMERTHHLRTVILLSLLGGVLLIFAILLTSSIRYARNERKKNRLLIERLNELDQQKAADACKQADTGADSDIDRLDRYMVTEKPFTDPALGRRELAAAFGVSQDEVSRIIREGRNLTVLGYINHHRLEAARHALEGNASASIAEIAVALGFGTARTLQRAFKAKFDMTPSQYRELSNQS